MRLAYIGAIIALVCAEPAYFFLGCCPFLLAMGIASLMEPLIDGAQRRLHFKRSFTAAALTLVLLGGLIALLTLLVGRLFAQASSLLEQLPTLLSRLPDATADLQRRMDDFCAACPQSLRTWVDGFLTNLSTQVVQLVNDFSVACLRALTSAITKLPQVFCSAPPRCLPCFSPPRPIPQL